MKHEADKNKFIVQANSNSGELQSRGARNLAARKLDAVLRIKVFQFPANAARKQIVHFRAENAGADKQFEIRNAPLHVFKTRHRFPAGVPTKQLQFDGKVVFRPSPAAAGFFAPVGRRCSVVHAFY